MKLSGLPRKLDYDDYAGIPPDRNRYEILDGELLVTPAPSPLHQWVSGELYVVLARYFHDRSLGRVFYAPIDVILTRHDVLQPDLIVVADAAGISKRGIEVPPLLAVEILSPRTAKRDRGTKARRYAELGVPHYWIVDPACRQLECFRESGSGYELIVRGAGDVSVTHPDWEGLTLDLAALWRGCAGL